MSRFTESFRENMVCFVEHCFRPPPTVEDPNNYLGMVHSMSAYSYTGLAFNHGTFGDPIAVLCERERIVGRDQGLLVPASYYHTDFFNNPVFTAAYEAGARVFPYEKARIIQAHQVNNSDFPYTKEQALCTYLRFVRKVREMSENGPFTLLIAPEGHRSEKEHFALQKAEPGVVFFARQMAPWVIVPIGITYDRPAKRNSVNFRSGPRLHITKPIVIEEPIGKQDQERLVTDIMVGIGSVLPPDMWGYYAPQIQRSLGINVGMPLMPNQP